MSILVAKKANSITRIEQLRAALNSVEELRKLNKLTVFVAGSYARNEASIHSDIDLFFVLDGALADVPTPNIVTMRAFSRIIEEADKLGFPAFSNDGEFLKILEYPQIAKELGGRNDDHQNYFTARMLMLLESVPIFNSNTYDHVVREILSSYFRDYTHHPRDFRPIFLVNDIIRFWKTLCLNYEHKRNQPEADLDRRIRQKIKNFKLKFSRMLTCYGSIVSLIDLPLHSGPEDIFQLSRVSPFDRLKKTVDCRTTLMSELKIIAREYEWFLETTNVHEDELLRQFHDKAFRENAFLRAEAFGDSMFRIVREVADQTGYLRYLVI
ncbi:MAG: nucleotidyltransferase domain-containing protein [Paracoccaceae bacterium]|nr:MAG: nucleotidyltransferase domain-containing protein [Paracoccaceae bacterium]